MKNWRLMLSVIIFALPASVSQAGEVQIVTVKASCATRCSFAVTLRHDDEGWQHYANQWEVLTLDNQLLGTRVLYHPHVDEQPFTRSLSGVKLPPGTSVVKIRAQDNKHGYASEVYKVTLPQVVVPSSPGLPQ